MIGHHFLTVEPGRFSIALTGINPESWATPTISRNGRSRRPKAKLVTYQRSLIELLTEALSDHALPLFPEEELHLTLAWQRSTSGSRPTDTTNILKGTEDALHEIAFANDRQVAQVHCVRLDQEPGLEPFLQIIVATSDAFYDGLALTFANVASECLRLAKTEWAAPSAPELLEPETAF